jgi:hypothetical protein
VLVSLAPSDIAPATSSVDEGFVVPMPTRPRESTCNRDAPDVTKATVSVVALYRPGLVVVPLPMETAGELTDPAAKTPEVKRAVVPVTVTPVTVVKLPETPLTVVKFAVVPVTVAPVITVKAPEMPVTVVN